MNKLFKYLKKSSIWLDILFIVFLILFLTFYILNKKDHSYNDAKTAFLVLFIIYGSVFVIFSYINSFLIFLNDWKHKKINSGWFKITFLILGFILMSFSNAIAIFYIGIKLNKIKQTDETEYIKPYPF